MGVCRACGGAGTLRGIGCGTGGCQPVVVDCRECGGSGEWDSARTAAWIHGRELARLRRDMGMTIREATKKCWPLRGVTPTEWSDAERGRSGHRAPIELSATLLALKD